MDRHEMHENLIVMKNGRVMRVKNGEMLPLDEELTMADGTRVMPDGTLRMTDGTARMMQEAETLRLVGNTADTRGLPDLGPTEDLVDTETHDPS